MWTLWQRVEKGTIVTSLARMLVSAYSRPLYALLSPVTTHTMLHLVIPLYQLSRATAIDPYCSVLQQHASDHYICLCQNAFIQERSHV